MVVDDELPIQRVLSRMLNGPSRTVIAADDGVHAMTLVEERRPDLILLDVNMPRKNGWEVLGELRRRPSTRLIPVIMLTSVPDKVGGLELGADDYMTKPFDEPELLARVEGLMKRHDLALSANPLTGLPGNPVIEAEVSRRLLQNDPFAFFYIDIDRFKAFNDARGFAQGDRVLLKTSALIRESMGDNFVGHVGGDDFTAICGLEEAPHAAQRLATLFDEYAATLPAPAGRPITLSIAVVSTLNRTFQSYAEVAVVASELKAYLKSEKGRSLSRFAFDRRGGD
jgi:diguanylate cyclase (GGDEF)-like protein